MDNHTDEHGNSAPAKSKVARRMRVALRGQKHIERRKEAKQAIYQEGAPIHAHRAGSKFIKKLHGPFRSRAQAVEQVGKREPKGKEVTTMRGKHGMDIRWARNPHYKI